MIGAGIDRFAIPRQHPFEPGPVDRVGLVVVGGPVPPDEPGFAMRLEKAADLAQYRRVLNVTGPAPPFQPRGKTSAGGRRRFPSLPAGNACGSRQFAGRAHQGKTRSHPRHLSMGASWAPLPSQRRHVRPQDIPQHGRVLHRIFDERHAGASVVLMRHADQMIR